MVVTLVQMDIEWGDADANCSMAETLMINAPKSDIYVLPEMFSTGFVNNPGEVVKDNGGESVLWMQKVSSQLDAAVVGSVAIMEDGVYYNRVFFVKPDGDVVTYDKRHLFTYGGEDKHYTAGVDRVIVEWRGGKFLLQVCYDLRFPVFSRNKLADGDVAEYDCALYVASWPSSRRRVWDVLLQARAIENQSYVVGVNRVGTDPVCTYNGGTTLVDAYGKVVAVAEDKQQQTVTATLDMESISRFRKKFPVLADGDLKA